MRKEKTMKTEHSHEPSAIANRLAAGPRVNYLKDWIYGGIDGTVTTFAIIAGSVGANLTPRIILILGAANILADGFSMAAANYSGSKAEIDDYNRLKRIEESHLETDPEGETEEIRQIFVRKGITGAALNTIIQAVTSRRDLWISTMMQEEYGLSSNHRSPIMAALATFFAFMICGALPLLPYAMGLEASAVSALVISVIVFFFIGAAKSRWSTQSWAVSGLETGAIGVVAAALAWTVGRILDGLI